MTVTCTRMAAGAGGVLAFRIVASKSDTTTVAETCADPNIKEGSAAAEEGSRRRPERVMRTLVPPADGPVRGDMFTVEMRAGRTETLKCIAAAANVKPSGAVRGVIVPVNVVWVCVCVLYHMSCQVRSKCQKL
jgi:hypothetical protein